MNKFVQWQRRMAGCVGKTNYRSWMAAVEAVKRMHRKHEGARLHPYRCKMCGGFHVGNNNEKEVH